MGFDMKWDGIHSSREWGKYPNEHIVAFILRTFGAAESRTQVHVLDLGFGGGANLRFLCEQGFSASGIDGSPHAVTRTEAFLSQWDLRARLVAGDMTNLGAFDSGSFDAVVDVRSMSNVPRSEVGKVVQEVVRVLKPGGYFVTLLYGTGCMAYQRGRQVEAQTFTDVPEGPFSGIGHVAIYDVQAVRDVLSPMLVLQHHRIREEDVQGYWSFEDHFVVCRKTH